MGDDNIIQFPPASRCHSHSYHLECERLHEARLACGLTQTELARRLGVSRQIISAYELGNKTPDPAVFQKIAHELNQPIDFFTKQSSPTFGAHSANFFRKKGADTKRCNQACKIYAKWFAECVYVFDNMANFPCVNLPEFEPEDSTSYSYSDEEIEICAGKVRQHLGLGLGPISNVIRLLEMKGILICRLEMQGQEIEAFSYWVGERPFIFLASDKKSGARARFNAAHELGHLCLHKWVGEEELDNPERLRQIEAEANRFAGAFLLPRQSFPNEIYTSRVEAFVDLKARWKVAIQAMIYRCKDLEIFDDQQITNMYKQISYKKWRSCEPLDQGEGAIAIEQPLLLRKIAEAVLRSGRYSVDELRSRLSLSDAIIECFFGLPQGLLKPVD